VTEAWPQTSLRTRDLHGREAKSVQCPGEPHTPALAQNAIMDNEAAFMSPLSDHTTAPHLDSTSA
jgi:hypothetical protein